MKTAIKSLLPYYGAKREQAAGIIEVAGPHHSWWDCFAGSLALTLAKPPSRVEVVNDLNGAAINLARVVQDDDLSVKLFEKLNRTLFCQSLFEDARQFLENHEVGDEGQPLQWAYAYFVFSWMARNGHAGTADELKLGLAKRFTSNGGDPATRFRNAIASIPAWWERLRGVQILQECGISLCGKIEDKEGVVIYADPPYFDKTSEYACDFSDYDHERLAATLHRFRKTKCVVSYYQHELVQKLYLAKGQFKLIDCSTKKKVSASGSTKAPEVLLVNF